MSLIRFPTFTGRCQPDCSPTEELLKEWKPTSLGAPPVVDIESGSAADEAGIKAGDIILQVDDVNVRSSEDVLKAVNKSKDLFVLIKVERLLSRRRGSTVGNPFSDYSFSFLCPI